LGKVRYSSFEREYNLKFLGLVGNIFLPEKIDVAIALGRDLDIYKRIADKPDFGSSKFAIVLVCVVDDKIFILETIDGQAAI
jgi:hypothetical protein